MKSSVFFRLSVALSILFVPLSVYALGFKNPSVDPRTSAMAGAGNADIASPAVLWYNPGGISFLEGLELSFGANFLIPKWERDDGLGTVTRTKDALYVIPDFYLSYNPENYPFAFGLALNSPFGNGIDWGETGFAKYAVTKARMTLFNIQPTASVLLCKYLSIGVGVNMYYGSLDYRNKLNAGVVTGDPTLLGTDIDSRFNGKGFQTTFTIGAMIRPIEPLTIGLVYRTGDNINFDGDLVLTNIPLAAGFGTDNVSYKAKINSIIPPEISFGISYYFIPSLKAEFDLNWTKWSSLNTQNITVTGNPGFSQSVPRAWEDSMSYAVGGEWYILNWFAWRLGYSFLEKSVPANTYEPSVPDTDRHVISTGFGVKYKKYRMNFAYETVLSEAKDIPAGMFWGKYDAVAYIVSLGMQYSF